MMPLLSNIKKMIMKRLIILQLIALFVFLQGCDKYEMIKYDVGDRLNFMGDYYWGKGEKTYWVDETQYLYHEINFGINSQGDSLLIDTVEVGVKLLGETVNCPRKVALKLENVTGEGIEVLFEDNYVMPADTGMTSFQVYVKRPVKKNQEYKAKLVFDYDQCDFEPGTLERQAFNLTCQDKVTMELWGISQVEWDEYYCMYFGDWSDTKARFIITTVGATSLPKWESSYEFFDDYLYLLEVFEEYKSDPANPPLLDDNGEWISFPDIFG